MAARAAAAIAAGLVGLALAGHGEASSQAAPPAPASATAPDVPAWPARLERELAMVAARHRARIGVHVRDLDTGATASYQADQRWYLASMVKVPVALAVLRAVDRGTVSLDTTVSLRTSDYVDGAGSTNLAPVGTHLSVRSLLEQTIVRSDNTAADVLIDLVGLPEVNAGVTALVPRGLQRITTLAEVRRQVYGNLVPNADRLSGPDLLLLRHAQSDAERVRILQRLVDAPEAAGRRRQPTLDAAYDSYYATGLNSGRLDAYADLLAALVEGEALSAASTSYLVSLMDRVVTGPHRLKAGLPPGVRFAHKTGTQRRRVCDAGLARWPEGGRERRVLLVACTRDEPSLERAEAALQHVGLAVCRSGLFTPGITDAPSCPAPASSLPPRRPAAVSPRR